MAPKYKLIYFDTPGAAEPIRYIFAYANQEYEDVRVKPADWPFIKPNTPFGKAPVLEIDGKAIPQSRAIARYLAKQFGLAGKDQWESLQCDVLVETILEFLETIFEKYYTTDEQKKETLGKQLEENIPFYLSKFNQIVADNAAGVLVGSQVTWADLYFTALFGVLHFGNPQLFKNYPALDSLLKKIHSIPGIKTWLDKRPPIKQSELVTL